MAYALQEVQPLEKDKKDPFYIRVDEQVLLSIPDLSTEGFYLIFLFVFML